MFQFRQFETYSEILYYYLIVVFEKKKDKFTFFYVMNSRKILDWLFQKPHGLFFLELVHC